MTPEIAALVERINGLYAKATPVPWKAATHEGFGNVYGR